MAKQIEKYGRYNNELLFQLLLKFERKKVDIERKSRILMKTWQNESIVIYTSLRIKWPGKFLGK